MSFKREFECPTGWCDCSTCVSMKGQEEDGTVICGHMPKQFTCPQKGCDSKQFVLSAIAQTLVDFSQEGAVEGHPKLERLSTTPSAVFCSICQKRVTLDMAQEMLKEIV